MPEEQNFAASYHGPRLQLFVYTLVDKNAAVAEVSYTQYSQDRTSADIYVDTGRQFAVARALRKLANSIERDADNKAAQLIPAYEVL